MIRCNHCGTNNLDGSEYCDECGTKLAVAAQSPRQAYTPPPAQFITQVAPPPPPSFTKDSVTPKPATPYTPPPPPVHPISGHSTDRAPDRARGRAGRALEQTTEQAADRTPDQNEAPALNQPAPQASSAAPPPGAPEAVANKSPGNVQAMNQTTAFNGQTSSLRAADGGKQEVMSDEKKPPAGARLIIQRGGKIGKEFLITATESMIGRWDADGGIFPDIDLDQDDPEAKVSRRHARIQFMNNQYLIEDLGSTNGTFINRGPRLLPGAKQPLNNGDEIIVGKTFLKFVLS
ncbi:MAG TPA: FHA domain-containing protein [Blastocatellia bacterium]|nr:FHA domain-containing protein [Blastocatellia bacterium]